MPASLILFSVLSVVGYALFARRWRHLWQQWGVIRPAGVNVAVAAATGIMLSVAGIAPLWWLGEFPDNGMSFAHEDFVGLSFSPLTIVPAFVWALLHQGLPEGLSFRGLLLGQSASKRSVTTAIAAQGGIVWSIRLCPPVTELPAGGAPSADRHGRCGDPRRVVDARVAADA